jgi:hypothetical protein
MLKRVTGVLVNKGDLVTSKQTYFGFDQEGRIMTPSGVGIVIYAPPEHDRCIDGNDCSVFWISTQRISKESSQCLKIISKSYIVNR